MSSGTGGLGSGASGLGSGTGGLGSGASGLGSGASGLALAQAAWDWLAGDWPQDSTNKTIANFYA